MYDLVTMGEILLRYSPRDGKRFVNAAGFDCYVGGAELNVAAGAAQLGLNAATISKIPSNALGEIARRNVLSLKVDDKYVLFDKGKSARLGTYYFENGSSPKKPEVIYDRFNTSFQGMELSELPEEIFINTKCFHTGGINLALGGKIRQQTIEAVRRFKQNGALISFDVNFRGNLWTGEEARACIEEILPMIDIFFCTEDTARLTFKKTGSYRQLMKEFAEEYDLSYVCTSRRKVISTALHSLNAVIYDKNNNCFAEGKGYDSIEVKDRIGSGDAYVSGVLCGLLSGCTLTEAIEYGEAMGAIKNTIMGDICVITKAEIDEMIKEQRSGFSGEMKR